MNINYTPLLYAMNECFEVEITFILSEKNSLYLYTHIKCKWLFLDTNKCMFHVTTTTTANKKKKKPLYLCKLPI